MRCARVMYKRRPGTLTNREPDMMKALAVITSALALSLILNQLFNSYAMAATPGPDMPYPAWFTYTSDLFAYLVKSAPPLLAGWMMRRSGFSVGATVGIVAELLQKTIYIFQFRPVLTWFSTGVIISSIFACLVMGAVAGAAGQLAARNLAQQRASKH